MKNCEYWQQQISRLLDGDLSPEEEAALWEHIAECPDCAQAFEDFSQQTSVLRAQVVRPPVDLSRLVMARIKNDQLDAVRFNTNKPVSHRLRPWRKLAAAACFVVLVAAGAIAGMFSHGADLVRGSQSNAVADAGAASYQAAGQNETVRTSEAGSTAVSKYETAGAPVEATGPAPVETPAAADEAHAAGAASLPVPVPEDAQADAVEGSGVAVPAAADVPAADSALSGTDADSGIMTIMEPLPTSAEEDDAPGYVFDSEGLFMGYIEDSEALSALLTGESWPGEAPKPVYTLTIGGAAYAFAADENGALLWQRAGDEGFTLSAAALADLEALLIQ